MRVLVLSGGGSKGGWAAGCLKHLLGDLKIQYDAIVGISSGAINAAFLGMYPKGQEAESIDTLSKLWLELDPSKIYKRWSPFGMWHVIYKQAFYDSTPLRKLIRHSIDMERVRSSGKSVSIGAVSLSSGKYTVFNQTSDDFVEAIIASASFPVMFEPIQIGDHIWSDGGIKTVAPLHTAIEMGATHIDAIVTSPESRDKKFMAKPSIIDIMKRSFDLYTEKIMSNDIEKAIMYNKLVVAGLSDKKLIKLNIIRPTHNLIEDMLDFDPAKIRGMMEKGYNDALSMYKP